MGGGFARLCSRAPVGAAAACAFSLWLFAAVPTAEASSVGFEDTSFHGVSQADLVYRADPLEINHLKITVDDANGTVTFEDPLIPIRPGTGDPNSLASYTAQACNFAGDKVTCNVRSVPAMVFYEAFLGDQNDSVSIGEAAQDRVTVDAGSGNDTIRGGAGFDDLIGGPGADDISGGGNDVADYSEHTGAVTVTVDDKANDGSPGEHDNVHGSVGRVTGSPYNDRLTGSPGNDVLSGGDGSDKLSGGGGDDQLGGGNGDDVLRGDGGNDSLNGDAGNDDLDGGAGADRVYGGDGNDTIGGRDGTTDRLRCDAGTDSAVADSADAVSPSCESVDRPAGYTSPLTEFPMNPPPHGIAAGPDGNLWLTVPGDNAVLRMGTDGAITGRFTVPTPNASVWDIAAGPDGNLWFTERGGVGRITPDGTITEFPVGGSSQIAAGPDGNVWATQGDALARVAPDGSATRFTAGFAGSLSRVARGPDGNVWVTGNWPSAIYKVDPATGAVTSYTSGLNGPPESITAGPDGDLWFTEQQSDRVAKITPAGSITEYSWPLAPESQPGGIAAGPAGNLWFSEDYGQGISRLTTAGQVTGEWSISARGGEITAGSDGNVWAVDWQGVARLKP